MSCFCIIQPHKSALHQTHTDGKRSFQFLLSVSGWDFLKSINIQSYKPHSDGLICLKTMNPQIIVREFYINAQFTYFFWMTQVFILLLTRRSLKCVWATSAWNQASGCHKLIQSVWTSLRASIWSFSLSRHTNTWSGRYERMQWFLKAFNEDQTFHHL